MVSVTDFRCSPGAERELWDLHGSHPLDCGLAIAFLIVLASALWTPGVELVTGLAALSSDVLSKIVVPESQERGVSH